MFFWEVVESARRLLLGAVLVVVFPRNELSQIAFGLLVAGIIIAGHARFHPYREENDNHLAFAANLVVVLTFFIGLLLFADAEEGRYDGVKTGFGAVAAGVIYGSTSGLSD